MKKKYYFVEEPLRTKTGIISPEGHIIEISEAHRGVMNKMMSQKECYKMANFKNRFDFERSMKYFRFVILDEDLYVLCTEKELSKNQYENLHKYSNGRYSIKFDAIHNCELGFRTTKYFLYDT